MSGYDRTQTGSLGLLRIPQILEDTFGKYDIYYEQCIQNNMVVKFWLRLVSSLALEYQMILSMSHDWFDSQYGYCLISEYGLSVSMFYALFQDITG